MVYPSNFPLRHRNCHWNGGCILGDEKGIDASPWAVDQFGEGLGEGKANDKAPRGLPPRTGWICIRKVKRSRQIKRDFPVRMCSAIKSLCRSLTSWGTNICRMERHFVGPELCNCRQGEGVCVFVCFERKRERECVCGGVSERTYIDIGLQEFLPRVP